MMRTEMSRGRPLSLSADKKIQFNFQLPALLEMRDAAQQMRDAAQQMRDAGLLKIPHMTETSEWAE